MESTHNYTTCDLLAASKLGALAICELLGVNTEMSYTKAAAEFGQFFKDAVRAGKIQPKRVGKGRNGTRKYAVSDIVALRAEEESKARLI